MKGTIQVENLSKGFNVSKNSFLKILISTFFNRKTIDELKFVLSDITFNVEAGEALGIIGVNGAGKSTLLKMLTQITRPTSGEIKLRGRVTSLLELGIGLHPDFTGRQNIFLLAQLLGFKSDEIDLFKKDVENFSELKEYIDQPVRVYSTGMQMRLAFSIVTAHRPDILIVDEALSVGDAHFQQKSFERIRQFKELGTTIILVSHDIQAVLAICDRAILLHSGMIAKMGEPEMVIDYYNALISQKNYSHITQELLADGKYRTTYGTKEAIISKCLIVNKSGDNAKYFEVSEEVTLIVNIKLLTSINKILLGFIIKDRVGSPVFGTNTDHLGMRIDPNDGSDEIKINFQFPANLGEGVYSISLGISNSDLNTNFNYQWIDRVATFEVYNSQKKKFMGAAWLDTSCHITN